MGGDRSGAAVRGVPAAARRPPAGGRFAGLLPAPGGLVREGGWAETDYGPVPAGHDTWAQCRLVGARPMGWGLLVEALIDRIEFDKAEIAPLVHYRGRYHTLDK